MLDRLTIKGFKSIRDLSDFPLSNLNILAGANGSGKSNFISFFRLLHSLMKGSLNRYVRDSGGAGDLLFNGRKGSSQMEFVTRFGERGYRFRLVPTPSDTCAIEGEARYYERGTTGWWKLGDSEDGKAKMVEEVIQKKPDAQFSRPVYEEILSWQIIVGEHFRPCI